MKLFSKAQKPAEPVQGTSELANSAPPPPCATSQISLSAEQKDMLDQPLNPRVGQILDQIYTDKTAAERALKSRQLASSPCADSGNHQVVPDGEGLWRIVPVAPPNAETPLFDAI